MGFGVRRSRVSPIGVDFGGGSMKVAQLDLTGDRPRLIAAAMEPMPEGFEGDEHDRLRLQASSLPRLLKGLGFKGKRAVGSLGSWSTIAQPIRVAGKKGEIGEDVILGELARMTGEDPFALVARWWHVGAAGKPGTKETDVVCVACPRRMVDEHIEAIRSARLDPVALHAEHVALVRAFDPITRRTTDHDLSSLYVDIGATTTKVVIARGRDLLFARTVDVGTRDMDVGAMESSEACGPSGPGTTHEPEPEPAEPLDPDRPLMAPGAARPAPGEGSEPDRRRGATPPGALELAERESPEPAALGDAERTLCDDVGLSIRYHGAACPGAALDRVVFVGGGAGSPALCSRIARTLRVSAAVADPLRGLEGARDASMRGVDLADATPGWATAIGLCLAPTAL
jgi:type IV pilus assembly protein PilM